MNKETNSNADNSDPLAGALAGLEAEAGDGEKGKGEGDGEGKQPTPEEVAAQEAEAVRLAAEEAAKGEGEGDDDHGEKSRLGRKVKRLETEFNSKLDKILERLSTPAKPADAAVPAPDDDFELSEYPTADELKRFKAHTIQKAKEAAKQAVSEVQTESQQAAQQYEQTYIKLMEDMTAADDENDDVSGEIKKLLIGEDKHFNMKHTGDPTRDFLINYRNATDFLLRKGKAKAPNVHGKEPKVPIGVNVPKTVQKVVVFDRSKMDPVERELAQGFTDQQLVEMGYQ